ncbi:MAG: hypothetical protein O7B25_13015 [Gammaproteobacteria bacterium]|nr:hypothetical protein [Gammaproteobacteria bacterium]
MSLFASITRPLLYVMEDFMEQNLIMKAIIGWGWLAILVMIASLLGL